MIESLKTSRDPGAMNEYLSKIVAVGPRVVLRRGKMWALDSSLGLQKQENRLRRPVYGKYGNILENKGKPLLWRIRHNLPSGNLT